MCSMFSMLYLHILHKHHRMTTDGPLSVGQYTWSQWPVSSWYWTPVQNQPSPPSWSTALTSTLSPYWILPVEFCKVSSFGRYDYGSDASLFPNISQWTCVPILLVSFLLQSPLYFLSLYHTPIPDCHRVLYLLLILGTSPQVSKILLWPWILVNEHAFVGRKLRPLSVKKNSRLICSIILEERCSIQPSVYLWVLGLSCETCLEFFFALLLVHCSNQGAYPIMLLTPGLNVLFLV